MRGEVEIVGLYEAPIPWPLCKAGKWQVPVVYKGLETNRAFRASISSEPGASATGATPFREQPVLRCPFAVPNALVVIGECLVRRRVSRVLFQSACEPA